MWRLKRLRESKFLTQRELSTASGVAVSTIVRLEKGQRKPNFATTKRLTVALGVGPEELTGMSFDAPESAPGGEPRAAVAAIRGKWKKKPDERGIADASLIDRREQALRETEETPG